MKQVIIKIPGTNIEISVSNADEMYTIFSRLNGWETLEVNGETFPANNGTIYTRGYFSAKYWGA